MRPPLRRCCCGWCLLCPSLPSRAGEVGGTRRRRRNSCCTAAGSRGAIPSACSDLPGRGRARAGLRGRAGAGQFLSDQSGYGAQGGAQPRRDDHGRSDYLSGGADRREHTVNVLLRRLWLELLRFTSGFCDSASKSRHVTPVAKLTRARCPPRNEPLSPGSFCRETARCFSTVGRPSVFETKFPRRSPVLTPQFQPLPRNVLMRRGRGTRFDASPRNRRKATRGSLVRHPRRAYPTGAICLAIFFRVTRSTNAASELRIHRIILIMV